MTLHPAVMCKAQAELDAKVGRGRPPTFDDADSLPYIQAIVKEVLRWRPVAPLGWSRRSSPTSSKLSHASESGVPHSPTEVSSSHKA